MAKGTTPGRKTVVTIDHPVFAVQQPAWWADLDYGLIGNASFPSMNVVMAGGIGWRLKEYQASLYYSHETSAADDAVYAMDVPTPTAGGSGVFLKATQRAPSELTGVDVSRLRVSGDNFYQKKVADGDSWGVRLSADATAFPAPPDSDPDADDPAPLVDMDRLAVSPLNHRPDEAFVFRFLTPGKPGDSSAEVARVYFTAIPGYNNQDKAHGSKGNGHMSLHFFEDGTAYLNEEREDLTWAARKKLYWHRAGEAAGTMHVVSIESDAAFDPATGLWTGTSIQFTFRSAPAGPRSFTDLRAATVDFADGLFHTAETYTIPKLAGSVQPQLEKIRVDVRRDIRAQFQVARHKYRPTGTLFTYPQKVPFQVYATPDAMLPIYVTISGVIPPECSVNIGLVCQDTGAACTLVSTQTDWIAGTKTGTYFQMGFTPVSDTSLYYAIIILNSSADGFKTPIVKRVSFVRNPVIKMTAATPVTAPIVQAFSVSGPSMDPSHETATLVLPDPKGLLARLDKRSDIPVRIEVQYDPEDATKTSTLFQGRIIKAPKSIKGPKTTGSTYPVSRWGIYRPTCLGEWARLSGRTTPKVYNFAGEGPDGKAPYKVTDMVRALLQGAGYVDHQIDVPDLGIRLFVQDGKAGQLRVEPFTDIVPLIVELVRQYLGAYFLFDANATNGGDPDLKAGCWRLIVPPSPPYRVLCNFVFGGNTGAVTAPESYPDDPVNEAKTTFIRKWTVEPYVEPAQGNYVIVDGVASAGDGGTSDQKQTKQGPVIRHVIYNWPAADFGQQDTAYPQPDPDHPDYTDGCPKPIHVSDPKLSTEEAVAFLARRIFDNTHARKISPFEAPLVLVTDPDDPLQVRPRPLRFGDLVTVDGVLNVVRDCNFACAAGYGQNQQAAYETFSVPALIDEDTAKDKLYKGILDFLDLI